MSTRLTFILALMCALHVGTAGAHEITGALIGTVEDAQGGIVRGAVVRVSSPALIGESQTITTGDRWQLRFPLLPPGTYALDVQGSGFGPYHEEGIRVGVAATIERRVVRPFRVGSIA